MLAFETATCQVFTEFLTLEFSAKENSSLLLMSHLLLPPNSSRLISPKWFDHRHETETPPQTGINLKRKLLSKGDVMDRYDLTGQLVCFDNKQVIRAENRP